jgi:hypothetical protein
MAKEPNMTKWFIDCNSIIHPIFGTDADPDWIVVSEDNHIVYVVDGEGLITGEYTLWNSLTELAIAIEGLGSFRPETPSE